MGPRRVRLMLDTHALLWALAASARLSKTARRAIEDPENEILVSAVSAWEMAIKKAMGRLEVPDDLVETIDEAGFTRKALGFAEAKRLQRLPNHHSDPFDRMLICHAMEERCAIVTKDALIARYAIETLW
jgi:PIN domain nuclease of toxin-antitoxin system